MRLPFVYVSFQNPKKPKKKTGQPPKTGQTTAQGARRGFDSPADRRSGAGGPDALLQPGAEAHHPASGPPRGISEKKHPSTKIGPLKWGGGGGGRIFTELLLVATSAKPGKKGRTFSGLIRKTRKFVFQKLKS